MCHTHVQPTPEGVIHLHQRVRHLSTPALTILANITGAPGPSQFREAVTAMGPDELIGLRDSLGRMGLEHTPTV